MDESVNIKNASPDVKLNHWQNNTHRFIISEMHFSILWLCGKQVIWNLKTKLYFELQIFEVISENEAIPYL